MKPMARECSSTIMGSTTRGNGKMMKCMAEGWKSGRMGQFLQVYLKKAWKVKENSCGPMATNIKGFLWMIKWRDSGNIHGKMGDITKDTGLIAKCMGRELSSGLTVKNTSENTKMTWSTAKGFLPWKMGSYCMQSGRRASCMGKESPKQLKAKRRSSIGLKEKNSGDIFILEEFIL